MPKNHISSCIIEGFDKKFLAPADWALNHLLVSELHFLSWVLEVHYQLTSWKVDKIKTINLEIGTYLQNRANNASNKSGF